MIDFHSHILPSIDDGAKDTQIAINIIQQGMKQGVNKVIFTPHFYDNLTTVDIFCEARRYALEALNAGCLSAHIELPPYYLGAEVALTKDTANLPNLKDLCIQGTELLLVELPYGFYNQWISSALYNIMFKRNLTPVIAHLDRYCTLDCHKWNIKDIMKMDIPIQINSSAFFSRRSMKFVNKLLDNENLIVLGSDVHNISNRCYSLDKSRSIMEKKFKQDLWQLFDDNAEKILQLYKVSDS